MSNKAWRLIYPKTLALHLIGHLIYLEKMMRWQFVVDRKCSYSTNAPLKIADDSIWSSVKWAYFEIIFFLRTPQITLVGDVGIFVVVFTGKSGNPPPRRWILASYNVRGFDLNTSWFVDNRQNVFSDVAASRVDKMSHCEPFLNSYSETQIM